LIDEATIAAVAESADLPHEVNGETVTVGSLELSSVADGDQWFDTKLPDAMPARPRGDYRERTINLLVRDAIAAAGSTKEVELIGSPATEGAFYRYDAITDPAMRQVFGDVLDDHFVVETTRRTRFLFPFHSDLPGNFTFHGRYKMFNGLILAFFSRPGPADGWNRTLLEKYYSLFNDRQSLSLLDRHALAIAHDLVAEPERTATPEELIERFTGDLPEQVFLPDVHRLIQTDLESALGISSLGRKDQVNAVVTVFYLHLALYFWRLAYILDDQVDAFIHLQGGDSDARERLGRACDGSLAGSPFRGQLRFRVAGAQPRKISTVDPAAEAFRDLNVRRLSLLPINLSLLRAARQLSGVEGSSDFGAIADRLASDDVLLRSFDAACRIAALAVAEGLPTQLAADVEMAVQGSDPGFLVLKTAMLKRWRKELRRSSTDITAQLMKRGGKGIFATRGNVQYFELGQDLLLLLTKLIAGDEAIRYSAYLDRLSHYGLAPQDRAEEELLADTLHALQLLQKYSDTGEAMYVHHFL
jgi:hypothetical protein